MRKKESYTTITPIPGFIPRQLAVDILHSHSEVITLNPLVIDHRPIQAPRDAASDEFYSTWYEITERMQFVPGIGRMGSGKIKFNGCFHNLPQGLQTHTYAPMNIDIRIKYRVEGNQPGVEPPPHHELGLEELGVPRDGLYLREDIEIRCNVTLAKYVKESLKTASKEMVSRIIKKAELLDSGVLQAMIEDGKLRTINPNDRSRASHAGSFGQQDNFGRTSTSPRPGSQQSQLQSHAPGSPGPVPYQIPRNSVSSGPSYQTYLGQQYQPYQRQPSPPQHHMPQVAELPSQYVPPSTSQTFVAELPGSTVEPAQQSQSQRPPSSGETSQSAGNNNWRWSQSTTGQPSPSLVNSSRPTSLSSDAGSAPPPGLASPGLDQRFNSDLPTHAETQEEHQRRYSQGRDKVAGPVVHPYNPADYARMR